MKKIILLLSIAILAGCNPKKKDAKDQNSAGEPTTSVNTKLKVVTTTTMLTDLLINIGGDKIELEGLMGAGVDPHLYKATAGDTGRLVDADIIVYSGLHLEAKLEDIFKKMAQQNKNVIVASDALAKTDIFESTDFEGNHDPHMWHDTQNWIKITKHVTAQLAKMDSKNADFYNENGKNYVIALEKLTAELTAKVSELPVEKRIMVTAHDAFSYFGRQHNFKVEGLQGISTTAKAGVQDMQNLVKFIIDNKLKAIFVESSVAPATIEAVVASVKDKGYDVKIGGSLYSDALGNPGTPEGTYIGMYRANMNTIVNALK